MLRSTYTVVTLEVSPATYDEIHAKLLEADYQHTFMEGSTAVHPSIDMTHIAIVRGAEQKSTFVTGTAGTTNLDGPSAAGS